MQASKDKVVTIEYTLTDDEGDVLDSSETDGALVYLHGAGEIIPGLEDAIAGKSVGEQFQVIVPPDRGYGEYDEALIQEIDRSNFGEMQDEIEVGMEFEAEDEDGVPYVVAIVEIGDETVTVDGNHELAGMTLHFDVTVADIRDATPEELEHGHAHGPGHEHHH